MNRHSLCCLWVRWASEVRGKQAAWKGVPAAASPEGSQGGHCASACSTPLPSCSWWNAQCRCALELESGMLIGALRLTLSERSLWSCGCSESMPLGRHCLLGLWLLSASPGTTSICWQAAKPSLLWGHACSEAPIALWRPPHGTPKAPCLLVCGEACPRA